MNKLTLPIILILNILLAGCGTPSYRYSGNDPDVQLSDAIIYEDVKAIERVLKSGKANPNGTCGPTPFLTMAIQMDSPILPVQLLLDHGADPNSKWALQEALTRSDDLVEMLLNKGARVDVTLDDGANYLHRAKGSKMVELLLSKGLNINAKDKSGNTPIMEYLRGTNISDHVFLTMLERGASINETNNEGLTPLHFAAMKHEAQLIKILLNKGADINARDREGKTALYRAIDKGSRLNARLLIAMGANVNLADFRGTTPLHLAKKNYLSDVEADLLARDANANARDAQGRTAQENEEYLMRQHKAKSEAEAKQNAAYEHRRAEVLERMAREAPQVGSGSGAGNATSPSIWEINADKSREALRDAQSHDDARRSRDAANAVQQRNQESKRCYSAGNAICP